MSGGELRVALDRLPERLDCPGTVAPVPPCVPQEVVSAGVPRFEPNDFLVLEDRFVPLTTVRQGGSEVESGRRVRRAESDRLAETVYRLGHVTDREQRLSQAAVRLGV